MVVEISPSAVGDLFGRLYGAEGNLSDLPHRDASLAYAILVSFLRKVSEAETRIKDGQPFACMAYVAAARKGPQGAVVKDDKGQQLFDWRPCRKTSASSKDSSKLLCPTHYVSTSGGNTFIGVNVEVEEGGHVRAILPVNAAMRCSPPSARHWSG